MTRIPQEGDAVVLRREGLADMPAVVADVFRTESDHPHPRAITVEAAPFAHRDCRPFPHVAYWLWPEEA